jgi:hypothetical protein
MTGSATARRGPAPGSTKGRSAALAATSLIKIELV